MLPPHKARKADKNKPQLPLKVKKISDVQEYIIKIDQQALVFEAHAVETSFREDEMLTEHQLSINKTLMSHADASDNWFRVKELGFATAFRPITVGEWSCLP